MKRAVGRIPFLIFVAAIVLFTLFPFYWAIISSLKSGSDLFIVEYWPKNWSLGNYQAIFTEQNFVSSIWNSVFVATTTVLVSLVMAVLASYSLGRVKFRGRTLLLYSILSLSMFPQIAILSGMFELVRYLGLYNKMSGLAISYLVLILPFTVWVLTTFMRELPKELEEAAIIDGCGPVKTVFRVFLPLMTPALVTTGLLAFIVAWNEFLFALTLTLTSDKRTVPVGIALLSGGSQYELPWGRIMAASVAVTIPLVVLVLIFQRKIVSGLTAGAVKG